MALAQTKQAMSKRRKKIALLKLRRAAPSLEEARLVQQGHHLGDQWIDQFFPR